MSYAPLKHVKPFKIGAQLFTEAEIGAAVGYSGNLAVDLAENASWIAYWGSMAAEAKAHHDGEQAAYRIARDAWATKRREEGKATKDALDAEWRTQPEYPSWYSRLATAEYAWNTANYVYEACTRKSMNLNAMVKAQLDELHAIHRSHAPQQTTP